VQISFQDPGVEGMDVNYFYMSRFIKYSLIEKENKEIKKKFMDNALDEDSLYIVDYYSLPPQVLMYTVYESGKLVLPDP